MLTGELLIIIFHLQVVCTQEMVPVFVIEVPTDADILMLSADICNLIAGTRVECFVSAFTSTNQHFYKGPESEAVSTVTYSDCEWWLFLKWIKALMTIVDIFCL